MTVINRNSGSPIFNTLAEAVASNMGVGQLPIVLGTSAEFDGGGIIYSVQHNGSSGLAMANGNELVKYTSTSAVKNVGTASGEIPLNSTVAPQAHGGQFMTYGGTADVITLTSVNTAPLTALQTGDLFRARITTTNTGAATANIDTIGALICKTPTGAALPAGFFRTDVDTALVYDGTDLIVNREIETTVSGIYTTTKYENLRMEVEALHATVRTTDTLRGGIYYNTTANTFTFPTPFVGDDPIISPGGLNAGGTAWQSNPDTISLTACSVFVMGSLITDTGQAGIKAVGDWA